MPRTDELTRVVDSDERLELSGDELESIVSAEPLVRQTLDRGIELGRYVIVGALGSGGMADVYLAYDPELDRKVAVKLLAGSGDGLDEAGRARLLREAQAMARLSHPNVVAVYDAGTFRDHVFVAMEHVEGSTLGQWLIAERRDWRTIVERFIDAGRGLAAAHAADIVHRDFKPANVMVGRDGRAKVLDFGLARKVVGDETASADVRDAALSMGDGRTLDVQLTRTGAVSGTPAYMASEQFRGVAVDARTDQFSFCVALYRALYGQRPFEGEDYIALEREVLAGRVREPAKRANVPAQIARALRRGLGTEPDDRHPSMDALLEELERAARPRWRRPVAAVTVVGLAAVGFLVQRQSTKADDLMCKGSATKLVGVWGDEIRAAVGSAFAATGKPYAADALRTVDEALGRYVEGWVSVHTDTCEATRVRGEQSEQLLDLRMSCLDQRLRELEALTRLFREADATVVERSVQASQALTRPDTCANTALLSARIQPPPDEAAGVQVEEIRGAFAEAKALRDAGKYAEAMAIVKDSHTRALELAYLPLTAEAWQWLAEILWFDGDAEASEQAGYEALWAAMEAGHERIEAQAWGFLVAPTARQSKFARARRLSNQAEAVLSRIGGNPELEAGIVAQLGTVAYREGKLDEAAALYEDALPMIERAVGSETTRLAVALTNLGAVYGRRGKREEALAVSHRAMKIAERAVGPRHPRVAAIVNNVGIEYHELGRNEEALSYFWRGLYIRSTAFGPDHPDVAQSWHNLASAQIPLGRYEDARVSCLNAVAINEASGETGRVSLGHSLNNLGEVELHLGRPKQALVHLERAIALWEPLGPDHPSRAVLLTSMGEAHLALGDADRAAEHLDRSIEIQTLHDTDIGPRGHTRFVLARALWARRTERQRSREQAERARRELTDAGQGWTEALAEVEAWLRDH